MKFGDTLFQLRKRTDKQADMLIAIVLTGEIDCKIPRTRWSKMHRPSFI